mgnify:CR=1 FL=1
MCRQEPADFKALNLEVRDIWDRNVDYWDERMGEENDFQRVLIGPAQERLLELEPDELVLESSTATASLRGEWRIWALGWSPRTYPSA